MRYLAVMLLIIVIRNIMIDILIKKIIKFKIGLIKNNPGLLKKGHTGPPRKRIAPKEATKNIFRSEESLNKAKFLPLISVDQPATISDSAFGASKGIFSIFD
jgi:hypothetical protein